MNPGVQVSDPEARQIFKENGCEVDEETKVVKIPEYIVRKALQLAPSDLSSGVAIKIQYCTGMWR